MDKLILSEYGTTGKIFALGVCGSDRFRELTENLLVNYGVIDYQKAKFHPLTDGFGYFVIDIDKYIKALTEFFHNNLWREKKFTLDDPAGWDAASVMAHEFYEGIEHEDFMRHDKTDLTDHAYQHGQN